jgi:hypothetical protein
MKARILLCVALGSSLMLGCSLVPNVGDVFSEIASEISTTGSGNVVTKEFDLSGFDEVEVSSAFDVEIRQGNAFSVVVRVSDSVEQYLDVVKQGSTLSIGLRPMSPATLTAVTLEAEVTMPQLAGLELSGASGVSVTDFTSSEALYAEVSGASSLRGDIEAGGVRFDVSGASDVKLSGSGEDLVMDVSGASSADLAGFPVGDADIQVSGASSVAVNVSGRLDVEASGASRVRYRGSPTLGSVDSSGGSSIDAW